ncbi:MAG: hypothetical protein EPO02_05140 [Nitrospirae bacterium]|nr:MAG: hypothetical protein EPO02_05140 [Nitrospirota bacterium]
MFPLADFTRLADAGVAFRVLLRGWPVSVVRREFRVGAPQAGVIKLSVNQESVSGDSATIHALLNAALINEDCFGYPVLAPEFAPPLDRGQGANFDVVISATAAASIKIPQTTTYRSVILGSELRSEQRLAAVEVVVKGEPTRHFKMALLRENLFAEVCQFSRRAPPRDIHSLVVAGMSWQGSPDASDLYDVLYGPGSADAAMAAAEREHEGYMADLLAIKNGTFSPSLRRS